MEKENNETLAAIQAKRGFQISTFDKTSRLQAFPVVIPAGTAAVKNFYFILEESFSHCTAFAIVENVFPQLTTKDVSITLSNDNANIFNTINYFFWKKTFGYLNKSDLFFPCYFRAKNNRVTLSVNYPGSSITGMNFFVVFKLENNPPVPLFQYNFFQQKYLIDENSTPNPFTVPLNFDSSYETVKGYQTITLKDSSDPPTQVNMGLRSLSYQGNIVMNEVSQQLLQNSYALSYIDSFFPLRFVCKNRILDINTSWTNSGNGDFYTDYYLFLVERPLDPTIK